VNSVTETPQQNASDRGVPEDARKRFELLEDCRELVISRLSKVIGEALAKMGEELAGLAIKAKDTEEQRALIQTTPDDEGDHIVLDLDDLAGGPSWCSLAAAQTGSDPVARAVAAYLATLPPAAPKPGETWEIGTGADTHTAVVVEAPDGSACFVWHPRGDIAIRHVSRFEGCRRKIADAPSGADQ